MRILLRFFIIARRRNYFGGITVKESVAAADLGVSKRVLVQLPLHTWGLNSSLTI